MIQNRGEISKDTFALGIFIQMSGISLMTGSLFVAANQKLTSKPTVIFVILYIMRLCREEDGDESLVFVLWSSIAARAIDACTCHARVR